MGDCFDHKLLVHSSTAMTISVAIIEDNASIRDGVAALINLSPGFTCQLQFESCEDALKTIRPPLPDIVLMDIGLGGMSGIEGVARLKSRFPDLKIIMLTVYEENEKIFRSLCAGASGYLVKKTPAEKLLAAIADVHKGGAVMTPSIAKKVLDMFSRVAPPLSSDFNLTKREQEILEQLVSGSSYKMIARDLFLSPDTVSSHIKSIYQKLQVHSKSQAVAKALKQRLV
jgi:DNA-binding NarL/FixJ family response regulator